MSAISPSTLLPETTLGTDNKLSAIKFEIGAETHPAQVELIADSFLYPISRLGYLS